MNFSIYTCVGAESRHNELIVFGVDQVVSKVLLYFPGDVQNHADAMHQQASPYLEWSLEAMGTKLAARSPGSLVIIVKPAKFCNSSQVSTYEHFLDQSISPSQHLALLLETLAGKLCHQYPTVAQAVRNMPFTLVFFSKSCLVFNALVADIAAWVMKLSLLPAWCPDVSSAPEWEYRPADTPFKVPMGKAGQQLWNGVVAIHVVDGHRYPTKETVVEALCKYLKWRRSSVFRDEVEWSGRSYFSITLHGSPRQLACAHRQYIREEWDEFTRLMKSAAAGTFQSFTYFTSENPSMERHFRMLDEFLLK